jgi:hypothetical protein
MNPKYATDERDIVWPEWMKTLRMPHDAGQAIVRMPNGFDDTIFRRSPDIQWRVRARGAVVVVTVNLCRYPIDPDRLPRCDMPIHAPERNRVSLLNDLHTTTDSQNRPALPFSEVEERVLRRVAFRRVATQYLKIVAPGEDIARQRQTFAQARCNGGDIGKHDRQQAARRQEPRPGLIETITAFSVAENDSHALGDTDRLHAMT